MNTCGVFTKMKVHLMICDKSLLVLSTRRKNPNIQPSPNRVVKTNADLSCLWGRNVWVVMII